VPIGEISWKWTRKRELAAKLVAEDALPDREIAAKAGVSQATIYFWRTKPEFMARVDELVEVARKAFRKSTFASAEYCAQQIKRDFELLRQVEADRARVYGAEQFKNAIPGGDTGKVVITRYRKLTVVDGAGRKVEQNVPIVAVDTQTELVKLAMLKQAQQHLGQWQEKTEGAGGDRLDELIEIAKRGAVGPEGEKP
jgi:AcrR family transcriptional regulator